MPSEECDKCAEIARKIECAEIARGLMDEEAMFATMNAFLFGLISYEEFEDKFWAAIPDKDAYIEFVKRVDNM